MSDSKVQNKLDLVSEIMNAYADCNHSKGPRNLNYIASASVNGTELRKIMEAATPDGYNEFYTGSSVEALIEIFGESAEYFVARESSVCIYVKPVANIWFSRGDHGFSKVKADEVLFSPKKMMFRFWWD
jgi:hypothetical protein